MSTNPLLRNTGSNEQEALERLELRKQLVEEYKLDRESFEFAAEYFDQDPGERDTLYTAYQNCTDTVDPGVFGLAHLWYVDESQPPLGRNRRALYHADSSVSVEDITKIRRLGIRPHTKYQEVDLGASDVLAGKGAIDALLEKRLDNIKAGQIGGVYKQGK